MIQKCETCGKVFNDVTNRYYPCPEHPETGGEQVYQTKVVYTKQKEEPKEEPEKEILVLKFLRRVKKWWYVRKQTKYLKKESYWIAKAEDSAIEANKVRAYINRKQAMSYSEKAAYYEGKLEELK